MKHRFESYCNTAVRILDSYDGQIPFHHFISQYFSSHKKHGSTDRRLITQLCYAWFRSGHSLDTLPAPEKLKAALFLCLSSAGNWHVLYEEEWLQAWTDKTSDRISFVQNLYPSFNLQTLFPLAGELSEGIDQHPFILSHFTQPLLFLRIRPGRKAQVLEKLRNAAISYEDCGDDCLALVNASKIDNLLALNREAVVQDLNSQQAAGFAAPVLQSKETLTVWDCCAASGGKSIMAYDLNPSIDLTVSDVRASIIKNLQERFETAGIKKYRAMVADLAAPAFQADRTAYDLVICDVPCTGSGTWGRTPEQLVYFNKKQLAHYTALQKNILLHILPYLHKQSSLLYITCSVFRDENEAAVEFLTTQFEQVHTGSTLQVKRMELLKGYDKQADSLFAALLTVSPL